MKTRKSYVGKLNGVSGIWCDQKPKGIDLEKEVTYYVPDEGKIFEKDGEFFDTVIIEDGVDIKNYSEVNKPKEENDD